MVHRIKNKTKTIKVVKKKISIHLKNSIKKDFFLKVKCQTQIRNIKYKIQKIQKNV